MDRTDERRANRVDLVAGAALFAVCGAFVLVAWGYGVGTPARMGPGFFPFAFGIAGMVVAAAIMARSFVTAGALAHAFHTRALIFVAGAVVAFGLLIETAGLGPAVFVSAILSSFADGEARLRGSLVLAAGLTVGVWVVFVYLLGLPMTFVEGMR